MDQQQAISSLAVFPHTDGSRVPYKVYSSDEIYALEQERIYRGPTWSFLGLEAEIPKPGDYKSTFVGDHAGGNDPDRGRQLGRLGQSLRASRRHGLPPAARQRDVA
jgi:hypothetical protein